MTVAIPVTNCCFTSDGYGGKINLPLSMTKIEGVLVLVQSGKCNVFFLRYLSVISFVINLDTLMLMIPELLQVQWYVCTYCFSQDHLELLFNSIRASGRVHILQPLKKNN